MEQLKRIKRELMYKGSIVDVYKDYIQTPSNTISEWDFIGHKGAAAVIPITVDGNILMVRQWRNALDRQTLEIPAGGLESVEESMKQCARRELEEETGYKSKDLEFLISIRTTIAFCNEKIDIFVARNLEPSRQNLDPDEYIDVEEYSVEELIEKIYDGEIQDSKTISGILAYKDKFVK